MTASSKFLRGLARDMTLGDPQTAAKLLVAARQIERWDWWRKWWFDERDDMEKLNGLKYDDPASLDAAIDAAMGRGSKPSKESAK